MAVDFYEGTTQVTENGDTIHISSQTPIKSVYLRIDQVYGDEGPSSVDLSLSPPEAIRLATALLREHNLIVYGSG